MAMQMLRWVRLAAFGMLAMLVLAGPLCAQGVTYEHDTRGRLTKTIYADGTIVDYTYDANGNRTGATVTPAVDSTSPSAPENLAATAISDTRVDLTWSASTDNTGVTGYRVERCTGAGCTSFAQIATPASTSYSDIGRSPNTTYVYRLRAYDAAGNPSGYSSSASATTPGTTAPSAPGAPIFSNVTMTSARATWSAASDDVGVTGYDYRLNSGSWVSQGVVLSVDLTGLSAATSYTFYVRARDGAGNVGSASSATFTTPDTAAPNAPGQPGFSNITMTAATASWNAATDNVGVTSYDYRLNSGNWQPLGNVLSTILAGLSPATSYTFQVRARDAANNVGGASSGTFTTLDTAAPSAPTGLMASAPSSTTVNLSWNAASDNVGVTGYKIFRNGAQIGTSAGTNYTDSSTAGTTTYSYAVRAYDAAGNDSAQSGTVSVTTPDTIAPSTPGGLIASAVSPTQVNLEWNASSDSGGSGLAGYRIYRGGSQIGTSSGTSYSDTTATGGTSYSYNVAAYDNAGNTSGQSNTANSTTPVPLQASVNSTTVSSQGASQTVWPVVVTASGGSGGYTYAWERVSGDTQTIAVSPTSNSTRWGRPNAQHNTPYTSVWRCRVSDSTGGVTYSPNVTVEIYVENPEM